MNWYDQQQPTPLHKKQLPDERKVIVQGRMLLNESYATLYFPPGVLPRGQLKLELQNLEFCAKAPTNNDPHRHFADTQKIEYPAAANYQNTIRVRMPAPRPLRYEPRRSMFTNQVFDFQTIDNPQVGAAVALNPAPVAPPPANPQDVDIEAGRVEALALQVLNPTEQLDAFMEEETALAAAATSRVKRDDASNIINVLVRSTYYLQPPLEDPPRAINDKTTVRALLSLVNGQLESIHQMTGYLHGAYPLFNATVLTPADKVKFPKAVQDGYVMISATVPYGIGLALPGLSFWHSLGFSDGTVFTAVKNSSVRLLVNLIDTRPTVTTVAKFPVHLDSLVARNLYELQTARKQKMEWPPEELTIMAAVYFLQNRLQFDIDLADYALPAALHRDIVFSKELLQIIIEYIQEAFHYDGTDFLHAEESRENPKSIMLIGFQTQSAQTTYEWEMRLSFSSPQMAQEWGFSQPVFVYRNTKLPFNIPGTLFPDDQDSVYFFMPDDDRRAALDALATAATNVVNIALWNGTIARKIPANFRALQAARAANMPELYLPPQNPARQPTPPPALPDYIEVEIPNPEVAPPRSFIPWSKPPVGRCEAPGAFPERYYVLLKEAEPTDYIVDYGKVCIWGQKAGSISSKGAILFNSEFEKELHIQILSTNLNLYIHHVDAANNAVVDGYLRAFINIKVLMGIM